MSQRERLQSYIQRRLLFLNQQINQLREGDLRERNLQRLRIVQRGRGREPRKLISDFYRINVNRTRQSRKFKAAQNVYNVSVKKLPENSPTFVRRLFRDVLKNVGKNEDQPQRLHSAQHQSPQFGFPRLAGIYSEQKPG
jgi:hypothetical protein